MVAPGIDLPEGQARARGGQGIRSTPLLGAPPAGAGHDRLAEMLSVSAAPASPILGRVLAAAWRAALVAVAEGSEPQQARAALLAFELRIPS